MEITRENLKNIDIEELALNPLFGSLTFDNSVKKLEKIKKWLVEFEELDYKNELPENIANNIDNHIQTFIGHLDWLRRFDIANSTNAKQEHDQYENQIEGFYNNVFNGLIINHLDFLRQEVELKSKDKQKIQNEQKELQKLRKQSEELVKQLTEERQKIQDEKEKIQEETKKIESAKSERAAVRFGKHFELQSQTNEKKAAEWLTWRDNFFKTLLIWIGVNVILYFVLFIGNKFNTKIINPLDFFTIQYGLANFTLLSILSYAVSFSSRNYNVNSNLASLNIHRKNVAETLSDFLESNPEPDDRSKIVEKATEAMFKHQPIGYLPKVESKDDGPVASIVNTILKQN